MQDQDSFSSIFHRPRLFTVFLILPLVICEIWITEISFLLDSSPLFLLSYQCKQLAAQCVFILSFTLIFSAIYLFYSQNTSLSFNLHPCQVLTSTFWTIELPSLFHWIVKWMLNTKRLPHSRVLTKKSSQESTLEGLRQWQYQYPIQDVWSVCIVKRDLGYLLCCP